MPFLINIFSQPKYLIYAGVGIFIMALLFNNKQLRNDKLDLYKQVQAADARIELFNAQMELAKQDAETYANEQNAKAKAVEAESKKTLERIKQLNNAKFSDKCEEAVEQGVGFVWDNNTP